MVSRETFGRKRPLPRGRTPLDERSVRRRNLRLTTYSTRRRETYMPPTGSEPAIPASQRPQTHTLDRAVPTVEQFQLKSYIPQKKLKKKKKEIPQKKRKSFGRGSNRVHRLYESLHRNTLSHTYYLPMNLLAVSVACNKFRLQNCLRFSTREWKNGCKVFLFFFIIHE